jgi:DNA-binding XRE family transcriptional regulator
VSDGTPPFGVLLRRLRTAASLTQEELAERSGTSVRGISDLERGLRHAPRLETVRLLAEALAPRDGDRAALLAAARPGVVPGLPPAGGLGTPGSLPAPLTRLIGRETEAAALRARLAGDGVRLVTVTGAGGTGKTRLALEVAARARDRYADGVFFVDLSPLTDPRLVVPTIAAALGVRESGDRPLLETLSGFLAAKRVLLVLDNCERVLAAASDVAALLAACPALVVLATSREAFHVQGEHRYPLTPLRLPGARRPAAAAGAGAGSGRRALRRAGGGRGPRLRADRGNASEVSAICHRLDGLPLAIELAAARAQALPPPALLARLEHRLPLLAGGGHDLPARQRTMRDAVAWSHDLLPADERAVFRRLAVFSGGFTLDAADTVAGLVAGGPGCWRRDRARGAEPPPAAGRAGRRAPLRHAGDGAGVRPGAAGGQRGGRGDPAPPRLGLGGAGRRGGGRAPPRGAGAVAGAA